MKIHNRPVSSDSSVTSAAQRNVQVICKLNPLKSEKYKYKVALVNYDLYFKNKKYDVLLNACTKLI